MTGKNLGIVLISVFVSACGLGGSSNPFVAEDFEETTRSTDQFKYREDRIKLGTVYQFSISNRDRSYAKQVALFVAATDRIESFKIYPGSGSTVLVIADIDWDVFSIRKIHQIEIDKDLNREPTIEMHLLENPDSSPVNTYMFMEREVPVGHFPVFNHGYDFSDLNFVFRHLANPKSDIEVGIIAPTSGSLDYTGKMRISYEGEEACNGHQCFRYSLGGRGVSDRQGTLLVNRDSGYFEYMELDANYHPQFDFFRYELSRVTHMNQNEWETFVVEQSRNFFAGENLN
jgi:hypothetical protein